MDDQIRCPHCDQSFLLNEVLKKRIEAGLKKAAEAQFEEKLKKATQEAKESATGALKLQIEEKNKDLKSLEDTNKQLSTDYKELKNELRELTQKLSRQERVMLDTYDEKLQQARAEIEQEVLSKSHLKDKEKDEKLIDATQRIRQLEEEVAKAKAGLEQNVGRLQGDVLEIDLAKQLKEAFPYDKIVEVKKFQKGADVTQTVKNNLGQPCGLILWEAKNALWQKKWLEKLREDMAEAKANIGILVSKNVPDDKGEMFAWDDMVWVVKPRLATVLADALRRTLIEVQKVSQHSNLKDDQMKRLYDYIVSADFKHKVEAMLDTYDKWSQELDKERKWMTRKWSRQEQMINKLTVNTVSIHSDFQGITNDALLELKNTDLPEDSVDFEDRELDVI